MSYYMKRSWILTALFLTSKIISAPSEEMKPLITNLPSIKNTNSPQSNPFCDACCDDDSCIKCDGGMCSLSVLLGTLTALECSKSKTVCKACGVSDAFICGVATFVGCFYYCKTNGESEESSTPLEG